ncbi:MAG: protein kinase [archaeon]|nr:protein kinase [archaeon]
MCSDWLTATPFPLGAAIVQARCYFQNHVLNPPHKLTKDSPRPSIFLLNFPMTNFIESSSEQSELSSESPRLTQADCSNPAPLPMDVSNDLTGTLRRKTAWMSWRSFHYVLRGPNLIEYKNKQSATSRSTKPLKIYFLKDLQLSAPDSARRASTFALQHLQSSRDPICFEAADQASLRSWVSALSSVCSSPVTRQASIVQSQSEPRTCSVSALRSRQSAIPKLSSVVEEQPQPLFKQVSPEVEGFLLQTINGSLHARWIELMDENQRLRQENSQLRCSPTSSALSRFDEQISAMRKSVSHPSSAALSSNSTSDPRLSFDLDLNAIQIGSRIHDGGSGASIHLATISGWQCLVKELQRTSLTTDTRSRFEFELATLESLPAHENLVQYLFHHTTPTHFQIFISRYDGSLGQVMAERIERGQPFSAREIIACLSDITSGLECLHRNDILHRDLKPDNIFVAHDRNNCVAKYVVGDFDSAKNIRDRGEARTFVGTLSYMAPEIFTQEKYGKSCDIWSISIILYELLTFERRLSQSLPFSALFGPNPTTLTLDRTRYRPAFHGLIDIFERCHVIDPLSRPTTTEVRAMLFECLAQLSVYSESPDAPLVSSPRRMMASASMCPASSWMIEKQLGAGASGNVSQVRHVHTGAQAAMKVVSIPVEAEGCSREDPKLQNKTIQREAEIMKRLDHPNIVQLQECFESEGKWHLVMELVTGGELLDRLVSSPDSRIPEPQARSWFRQIVSAVHYCHANGVVHRDLKLENILIDAAGQARITDFGLANFFASSDAFLKTLCGSARYAPPEILAGGMYRGPPLDVWALGIILFVMLAGEFPWKSQTEGYSLMNEIILGRYNLPSHVSKDAGNLIASILLLNPDDRPSTAQILAHPWLLA